MELGKPESLITFVADRHGHDQRYAIDPPKANVELNWDPVTTFEEGIKKTISGTTRTSGGKTNAPPVNIRSGARRTTLIDSKQN